MFHLVKWNGGIYLNSCLHGECFISLIDMTQKRKIAYLPFCGEYHRFYDSQPESNTYSLPLKRGQVTLSSTVERKDSNEKRTVVTNLSV